MAFYPITQNHFTVEWGGASVGFTEVSGLDSEVAALDYREGNNTEYQAQKVPGTPKFTNITLKRGILDGRKDFDTWLGTVQLDKVERRTIKISLLNEQHQPIMTWQVNNGWVCKLTGPSLKAQTAEIAMESIEICHEGLVKIQP